MAHPLSYSMHSRLRLRTIKAISSVFDGAGWTIDLGCGSCFFLEQLPNKNRAVGIDTDWNSLKRWRGRGYHLVAADLRRLPFRSGRFEGVIASEVMEHLPPPADLDLLREIRRVATPTAEIALTVPASEGLFADSPLRNLGHTEPDTGEYHFTRHYPIRRLLSMFSAAGLEVTAHRSAMRLWGTLFMDAAKAAVHARIRPKEHSDLLKVETNSFFFLYRMAFAIAFGAACLEEFIFSRIISGHIRVIAARVAR